MTADEELATARRREDITSLEARRKLATMLDWIGDVLDEIDRGAGFCEDRGFGWGYTQERDLGSDAVFTRLREWPILRRLLPSLRHLRHQTEPVIATQFGARDEVRIACDALYGNTEFTTRHGTDWEETILTVRLDPDVIVVAERTVADDTYGRPFQASEDRLNYPDLIYTNPTWKMLLDRFQESVFRRLISLAGRRWKAGVPCDRCGMLVHRHELPGDGLELHHWSCWGEDAPTPIDINTRAAMRDAMPVQDLPAIRTLNPRWARGYCEACDAAYSRRHGKGKAGRNWVCPEGHTIDEPG